MQDTMILATANQGAPAASDDTVIVTTPLDAIMRLEKRPIRTIVLAGSYATNRELAAFLGEFYPSILVVREV